MNETTHLSGKSKYFMSFARVLFMSVFGFIQFVLVMEGFRSYCLEEEKKAEAMKYFCSVLDPAFVALFSLLYPILIVIFVRYPIGNGMGK